MCNISRKSDPYCLLIISVIFIPLSMTEILAATLDIVGWPCIAAFGFNVISVLDDNITSAQIVSVSLTGVSISLSIFFNFIISVMMICSCVYVSICYIMDRKISVHPSTEHFNNEKRSRLEKRVIWTLFLIVVALALPAPVANVNFYLQQCIWAYFVVAIRLIFSCTGTYIIVIAEYCHNKKDIQGMVDIMFLIVGQNIELNTTSCFLAVSLDVLDDDLIYQAIKDFELSITVIFIISAMIRYFLTAVKLFWFLTSTNLSKLTAFVYELVTHLTFILNWGISGMFLALSIYQIHNGDDRTTHGSKAAIGMIFIYLASSGVVSVSTSTFCGYRYSYVDCVITKKDNNLNKVKPMTD